MAGFLQEVAGLWGYVADRIHHQHVTDRFVALAGYGGAGRAVGEPGRAPRDLDVLVVGSPGRIGAHRAADELSERLGLRVQVTFATEAGRRDGCDPGDPATSIPK
jgi:hypothetical protein